MPIIVLSLVLASFAASYGRDSGTARVGPPASGVAAAARGRTSERGSAAAAGGLAFAGLGLLHRTHFATPWAPAILVAVPVAQLAAAILIERGP